MEPATKELFPYQKQTVATLLDDPQKRIVVASVGLGKGAIAVVWAYAKCQQRGKHKILVITTASKCHARDSLKRNDFEQDADTFVGEKLREQVTEFETVSWDLLYKWVEAHRRELDDWVYIADECFKMKAGVSSRRGRAFLKIAATTIDWTGYTATPGDTWNDYQAYFQSTGLVRNKTAFRDRFCIIQTFKGFPEIVGYREEETMRRWWATISYAPDTTQVEAELPSASYHTVMLPKPRGYDKVIKLRQRMLNDGSFSPEPEWEEIISNPSALAHYLRQLCFTKDKQAWVADFLEGLGEQAILFYNYKTTGDTLETIAKKVLPKGARVWRIDGAHHEIPTRDTIGKYDVVLAQWQSGAEGLNLQFMRYWVAVEPTYVYSTRKQAMGRISRVGQTRAMFYYQLATSETIELDILKTLQTKQDFALATWLLGKGLQDEKALGV